MAKYQNKKSNLGKSRFFNLFKDLPKESQLNLIKILSNIEKEVRL